MRRLSNFKADRIMKMHAVKRFALWSIALTLAGSGMLAMAQPAANDLASNPFANDPAAPDAGKAIFDRTCSSCHGAGATGSERAPALTNTGTFQHGGKDNDVFQTIKGGVPNTPMPAFSALPSDTVWRLVTYIESLSGQTGALGRATGNAANGEALFFGTAGCTGCHEVNGRGADFATDLSDEGTKPVATIKIGVLHQPAGGRRGGGRGPAPARYVDIVTKTGAKIHGLARNEDSFDIQVEGADGRWTTYDKKNLKSIDASGNASPTDIATRFTPAQVDDIVAYLANQKGRDFAQAMKANPTSVLPYSGILKPSPSNWPTYWGDYQGRHFSALSQITPANAHQVQARWATPILGTNGNSEASPIVVDGVLYFSSPGEVEAVDARTGMVKWAFHRKQDVKNPYQNNANNKGVAVLDGRVFVGTLDDNLIALDANTGRELWEVRTADTMTGAELGGAPLALDGKIIMGMAGGEFGVRGYLDAYDPATGKRLWRTYTVPGPGEPGNESWPGDTWKLAGAPTWLTGSYDAETHTIYWGVGNPGPDYDASTRPGDNLYSDSVLAFDPDTGKIKWHYQFTPNDDHDWDSTEDYVLTDLMVKGKMRKVMLHADRNGVYYVLDRNTGEFLFAKPFVKVNWVTGWDAKGRPIVNPATKATKSGNVVFPATGGTNFQAPSYDEKTGLFFLEYVSSQGFAIASPGPFEQGKLYLNRGTGAPPPGPQPEQGVEAIDAKTGNVVWKFPLSRVSLSAGVMATKGGVLFVAGAEGQMIALESKTGKLLWHTRLSSAISASPVGYSVGGKQFVAVVAGNVAYGFSLPE
jgi:alcohol dehydrogenase (cytochrome c)